MKEILSKPIPKLILAAAVILSIVIGGVYAYNASQALVETENAYLGTISSNIEASGTIEARQTITIRWMSSGVVKQVFAEPGDKISSETPIAMLDLDTVGPYINNAYSDMLLAEDELDAISSSNVSISEARDAVSSAFEDLDIAQKHYNWVIAPRTTAELNDYIEDDIQAVDDQLDFMAWLDEMFYSKISDNNPKKIQFNLQVLQLEQARSNEVARLVWFNSKPTQNDIDLAAGQLAVAQATYDDAVRIYARVQADDGRTETTKAETRLSADKSVVGQAFIINTIDGVLTQFDFKPGDVVQSGTVAARVDDLSELHVKLLLSEVDVNRVQIGDIVVVTSQTDPALDIEGTIESIELAGRVVNNSIGYEVIVSISGDTATLKPGNSVDLMIEVDRAEQALLVPTTALRIYNGQKIVFVYVNGEQVPVAVRTGIRNLDHTQIVGGNLKEGDAIVLSPPAVSTLEGVMIQ